MSFRKVKQLTVKLLHKLQVIFYSYKQHALKDTADNVTII